MAEYWLQKATCANLLSWPMVSVRTVGQSLIREIRIDLCLSACAKYQNASKLPLTLVGDGVHVHSFSCKFGLSNTPKLSPMDQGHEQPDSPEVSSRETL